MRPVLFLAGIALGATAAQAHAPPGAEPPAPASTVSGVTVSPAQKPTPLVNPESQFVRLHLPEGASDQFPRFRDAVCVKVQGLPPEFDAFVAKRVVDLARTVKAPVDPSSACTPNVNVIF